VEPSDGWSPLEWARYYRSLGIQVIPATDGRPSVKWEQYQTEPASDDQITAWFKGESFRKLQMFAVCGRVSNLVVLDCDSDEADAWWRELIGAELMDSTARVRSGGGRGAT
jgi:hypothetical protein